MFPQCKVAADLILDGDPAMEEFNLFVFMKRSVSRCLKFFVISLLIFFGFRRNPRGKTPKEKNAARSSPPSYAQR